MPLLADDGGVKYEESNLIFLVVFVKDPLEVAAEVDFDGLALGVLPVDDASLGAGTAVSRT